jgi:predicted N-acetyltransferase YhbS
LDREFDGTSGLIQEFPLLVGAGNRSRRLVIAERGEIVAHAAWRPFWLRSNELRFTAAGIGLVTTARERRGHGLASCVVRACIEHARAEGAELALLFAAERDLYRRLGFVPAGRERVSTLEGSRPAPSDGKVRIADARDAAQLLPILAQHQLRVERSVHEFEELLAIPGAHTYVLERQGRPIAYCVEGKGRDLRGFIHEWAGAASAVAELLGAVSERLPRTLYLLSPEAEPAPLPGQSTIQALAQIQILRPERFGGSDAVRIFGDPQAQPRVPVYLWGLDSV